MIIEIDNTLQRVDTGTYRYWRKEDSVLDKTIAPENRATHKYANGKYVAIPGKETYINSSFKGVSALTFHSNYSEYLCQCYANHLGIVLTPDIFWHTVLSEIAKVVVDQPDKYSSFFTNSPDEKVEITVMTDDVTHLPLNAILEQLKELVPTDTVLFFPKFSTTTQLSLMAQQAAFAEMCSPYYSYSTMMCGYPAIDIRGYREDYQNIKSTLDIMKKLFTEDVVSVYTSKLSDFMTEFLKAYDSQDKKFFSNILTSQSCGSGGEIEVSGWYVENMFVKDYSGQKPENLPSNISRVPYKNSETGRNFTLNCGLFFCKDEDNFAIPEWGWVVNEILDQVPE